MSAPPSDPGSHAPRVRWTGRLDALTTEERRALVARAGNIADEVRSAVAGIRDDVLARGDQALLELTARFDGVELDGLRVGPKAIEQAHARADPEFVAAFDRAAGQVRAYHETLASGGPGRVFDDAGVRAWERQVAVGTAGVYVPGGRAAYPSTVLMTVVPAQTAGVERIVVCSPPGQDGLPHPLVLAACHALGVDEVYAVGGAQAVFAMALGTGTVPRCDVVVGPGSAYVQAAKQLVAGTVRIDAPAGPSEVAVLVGPDADDATLATAARELVAQAEHDPATQAVAVCLDERSADRLVGALGTALEGLPKADAVRTSLAARGAILTATGLDEALAFLDELAPEHAILLHPDGPALAERLVGPACIVAGPDARVALTDYVAGPSHVLPTGGAARAFSGLGTDSFTKRVHVAVLDGVDPDLRAAAAALARLEGLEGHARSLGPTPTEAPDGATSGATDPAAGAATGTVTDDNDGTRKGDRA